jgi:hypothetical protein
LFASKTPPLDIRIRISGASYEDWKKAFAMCSDDGAIVFH